MAEIVSIDPFDEPMLLGAFELFSTTEILTEIDQADDNIEISNKARLVNYDSLFFISKIIFHSFQHENRGFSSKNTNSKNVCGDAGKEHNIYSS